MRVSIFCEPSCLRCRRCLLEMRRSFIVLVSLPVLGEANVLLKMQSPGCYGFFFVRFIHVGPQKLVSVNRCTRSDAAATRTRNLILDNDVLLAVQPHYLPDERPKGKRSSDMRLISKTFSKSDNHIPHADSCSVRANTQDAYPTICAPS